MEQDITLTCDCGSFEAVIHGASNRTGNHVVCYCRDCRAAARHLKADRVLDELGGTAIYQTQPYQVDIRKGAEHLALMQLSKKGLFRWYVSCCNTPICNTVGTPQFSFAGFITANMANSEAAIGPVQFHNAPDQALGKVAAPKGAVWKFALRTIRNALWSRLNGNWRKTPFFDVANGLPVAEPKVLTSEERSAAYGAN